MAKLSTLKSVNGTSIDLYHNITFNNFKKKYCLAPVLTFGILKPPKVRKFSLPNLNYLPLYRFSPTNFTSTKLFSLIKSHAPSRLLYLEEKFYCMLFLIQTSGNRSKENLKNLSFLMETVTIETVHRNKTQQNQSGTKLQ